MNSITLSTATIDAAERTVVHVITAAIPDRTGDLIVPSGLANRDEFLRNPVVLWAHQRTLPPIGTCIDLQVTKDRVIAVTKFATSVLLAEDLFRLYEQGILRGWSIGFVPKRAGLRAPTRDGRRGMLVESWDLLEYSAVPVPENPHALTMAIRKGIVSSPELFLCASEARCASETFHVAASRDVVTPKEMT